MRRTVTAALIASSLLLGACGPVNRGLDSVHQPVVQRSDYVFDVSREGLTYGPASPEAVRLAAWLNAIGVGYGDRVSLDDPSPYGAGETRDVVAAVVARRGLLLSDTTPVTAGTVPDGAVRVIVSRSVASVPDCPNWDRTGGRDLENSTMSNYGCAVNSNLAAMVADPQDLVEGRSSNEGTDARTVVKAITQYRTRENMSSAPLPTIATRSAGQ